MEGWKALYPDMIEWVKGSQGGQINRVDTGKMTVYSRFGQAYKGDVINLIPPQKAGKIAHVAGLTNKTGWCPVNQKTFESTRHKHVYVIGDACVAGAMVKSAFSASSQAKICAAAIISDLQNSSILKPVYNSAFYSLIAPKYGISSAVVYRLINNQIKPVSGGVSPIGGSRRFHYNEAKYAAGWYRAITSEAFAK